MPQPGQVPAPGQPFPQQGVGPQQPPAGYAQQPGGFGQQAGPGQQPPVGQVPADRDAALRINVQGSFLTSNMVPPKVLLDGWPVQASVSAPSIIPVPSGRHHLDASSQWLREYGQASLDVDVAPHTTVDVYYAPPWHQFSKGAMGLQPQQRKGLGSMLIIVAVIIVVVVLIAILGSLG